LLSLQSSDGRFQDLNAVLQCLNVPTSTKFSRERILVTGECNYSGTFCCIYHNGGLKKMSVCTLIR